ncbi:MAG TPA: outer membrane beta-barrel protein [Polyangiaceae bacterium]|nr:outer membrane beta-barrel protein [Polyangiaceae bacterium]
MLHKCFRSGVCFGVGLACVVAARGAAAEHSIADAAHLSLDGSLLGYQKLTFTPNPVTATDPLSDTDDQVAPAAQTASSTTFGLLGTGFGVGLGYGLTNDVLLGVQLELTSTQASSAAGSSTNTTLQFLPRLEYVFEGADARPYVAAILGIGHSSVALPAGAGSESGTQYLFGGSFGVHAFLSDTLSIDPALTFLGQSGSETDTTTAVSLVDGSQASTSQQGSTSGYSVVFSIGLSAWLGGPGPRAASVGPDAKGAPVAESVAPVAAAPAAAQPDPDSLSESIGLPNHRELFVQVASDPSLPSVIAQVYVREDDAALADCKKIRVMDGDTPLKLRITGRGDKPFGTSTRHFVVGVLPVHALTLLARPGSALTVCDDQWPLTPKARHKLHAFLAQRLELVTDSSASEPLEPEAPSGAADAPAADAPAADAPSSPSPDAARPAVPAPAK